MRHTLLSPCRALIHCLLFALLTVAALPSAWAASRLALIIGNDQYRFVPPLQNAVADANTMADAFRKAGYKATVVANRDLKSMKDDIRSFRKLVQSGDEVVFFYSGHGTQMGGENFLLPIDVRAESADQVRDDALSLSQVLNDLRASNPAFTLAIVDACRDNPFASKGRAIGGRGLTGVAGATGQMVMYAAGEGQQALDRLGPADTVRNGVFTRVFVREMTRPGLPIDQVLRNVRVEVNRLAASVRHEQVPALYDQVLGTYYFYPPTAESLAAPPAAPIPMKPGVAGPQGTGTMDLADLQKADKEDQARKAEWSKWQTAMKSAFDRVGGLSENVQLAAWERFVTTYQGQNNPFTEDDEALMAKARQAINSFKNKAPTGAKAVPGFKDCDQCPEMVWLPTGSFAMGAPDSDPERDKDEGPVHEVKIGRKLAMGRFHVTVDEFTRFVQDTGYITEAENGPGCLGYAGGRWRVDKQINWRNPGYAQLVKEPVVCVSHNDAKAYVRWLQRKSGKPGYRLPSEAEWEYAARAGTTTRYVWGDEANSAAQCTHANAADTTVREQVPGAATWAVAGCSDGYAYMAPVGSFRANAFGLHDMIGNAWQWLEDTWHEGYAGAPTDGSVWDGGDAARRVLRGGSWYDKPRVLRPAIRNRFEATRAVATYGFRVARSE